MASPTGVLLSTGEEIPAKAVISNADPKRTLLKLVDPTHLSPGLCAETPALPHEGHGCESQSRALTACRTSPPSRTATQRRSRAAFRSAMGSTISSAPSTNRNTATSRKQPYLEVDDSFAHRSDACAQGQARHVDLHAVRPYKLKGDWEQQRGALGQNGRADARAIRAESAGARSDAPDHHAARPGRHVRPDRRPDLPRRAGARPVLHHAPAARLGAISHADCKSVSYAGAARIQAQA